MKMSLLAEILEYLTGLEELQRMEATRSDRSVEDRYVYRERAEVIREAIEELKKRYV